MLNDKTVDFLSDNIDCAIRVGAEVDPATVSVLLAEVPRSVVATPALLAQFDAITVPEQLSSLPRLQSIRSTSITFRSPINTAGNR